MTEQFQTGLKKPGPNNGATRMIIEIIPERKGFMHDRARDLYVKLPIMKLTPEAALYA